CSGTRTLCFFFQAEDGIRDFHVTGVQTCALPILRGLARAITLVEQRDPSVRHLLESLGDRAARPMALGFTGAPGTGKSTLVDARSEERRVGKECRWRGAPARSKVKGEREGDGSWQ